MLSKIPSANRLLQSIDASFFTQEQETMQPALGFSAVRQNNDSEFNAVIAAQNRALSYFPHIKQASIQIGTTRLFIWGRGQPQEALYKMQDGSFLLIVGSPLGQMNWRSIVDELARVREIEDYRPQWNGRFILLQVAADGNQWIMWNDWMGSIPVYHHRSPEKTIASTLEPVVVSDVGLTSDDFFLPGVLSLLIHGNFIADWTLFKSLKVVRPDTVAIWKDQQYFTNPMKTVVPSDENCGPGWHEMRQQMYELSRQAIKESLNTHPTWVLPLSGGFDSRLIAAIGIDTEAQLSSFTWGAKKSLDPIYAKAVARDLNIPWQLVKINSNYLRQYTRLWADLFGSSMHFHGMYQMPFLDSLDAQNANGPILSGFIGESLAGYDVKFQCELHNKQEPIYQAHPDDYIIWSIDEIQNVVNFPLQEELEILRNQIQSEIDYLEGPWFQRLRFLTLWGRQHYFTYFQSMLSDYWRGVATPFLNRDYAQFCLSLPRAALDERRLQQDMFSYYLGAAARIPVTYYRKPLMHNGRFYLKRKLASLLPKVLHVGSLQEFNPSSISLDGSCVQRGGEEVLWPVYERWNDLQNWFDLELLEKLSIKASTGDMMSVKKMQAIQTIAYRCI